jgi:hypothetical protein
MVSSTVGLWGNPPRWNGVCGAARRRRRSGTEGDCWRGGLVRLALMCFGSTNAPVGKFQDRRVVHQPVDGGHGGHRILEDLVPL